MKKLVFLVALSVISTICRAEIYCSTGEAARLASSMSPAYIPYLSANICEEGDKMIQSLCLVESTPNSYVQYDEDSRILIKFEDGTKFTLHRLNIFDVVERYNSFVIGSNVYHEYVTSAYFECPQDFVNKVLSFEKIVKFRAVFSNGNIDEREIKSGYQKKFIEKLRQSFISAYQQNRTRESNDNDDNF